MRLSATVRFLRSGRARSRIAAVRDGQAAIRIAMTGAALDSGVVDMLAAGPLTTDELLRRGGWTDRPLLEAFLLVLDAAGHVRGGGTWRLTRRGRAALDDDVVRAAYEAFSGYHTGLYRDLPRQLAGGPARRDIADRGELVARLSVAMEPFLRAALEAVVHERQPRRVLDVGCGSGMQLVAMLRAAPGASGVGVETDAAAAALARERLARTGLTGRGQVVTADVRDVVADPQAIGGAVDLALLANVVYYLPPDERLPLLRAIRALLSPGGALVVVTTALTDAVFSRHFDLLLRAQGGGMGLPYADDLLQQLRDAGLTPQPAQRIAPREPLVAVVATAQH